MVGFPHTNPSENDESHCSTRRGAQGSSMIKYDCASFYSAVISGYLNIFNGYLVDIQSIIIIHHSCKAYIPIYDHLWSYYHGYIMLYTHFKPQLHPQVVDKSDADDELHIFTD